MLIGHENCKDFLLTEIERRVRSNPRYSQRAFARQMGISAGELSEVLSGKRRLSTKSALKISKNLNFNSEESEHLLFLIQKEKARSTGLGTWLGEEKRTPQKLSLTLEMFEVISNWICFAVLNLSETRDFSWDEKYISTRLGVSSTEVKNALNNLEKVGLIEKSGVDYNVAEDYVISPDGIPSEAIKNYHESMLQKAQRAVHTQNVHERDISGVGFAVNLSDISKIKKEISDFHDKLVSKYSTHKGDEVYQLESALFRVSVPRKISNKNFKEKYGRT